MNHEVLIFVNQNKTDIFLTYITSANVSFYYIFWVFFSQIYTTLRNFAFIKRREDPNMQPDHLLKKTSKNLASLNTNICQMVFRE